MSQRMDWAHLCGKLATGLMGVMVCLTRGSVAFNLRELPRLNDLLPLVVLAGLLLFLAVVLESGLWQISGRLFQLFTALTGLSSPAAFNVSDLHMCQKMTITLFLPQKNHGYSLSLFSLFCSTFAVFFPLQSVCHSFFLVVSASVSLLSVHFGMTVCL